MIVSLIVAVSKNYVIGKNNSLIWHLPKDMAFFKSTTINNCIITGRKNYESIPKKYRPLKDRTNIVVTRQKDYNEEGIVIANSIENAILKAREDGSKECFIIGGGQIYDYVLKNNLVDKMYITHIQEEFEGDTFFPQFDISKWDEEVIISHIKDETNVHSFVIKVYNRKG